MCAERRVYEAQAQNGPPEIKTNFSVPFLLRKRSAEVRTSEVSMKKGYKVSIAILGVLSFAPLSAMVILKILNVEIKLCWIYLFVTIFAAANLSSYITQGWRMLRKAHGIMYTLLNASLLVFDTFLTLFITLTL